jgi:poly(3-hydroxybutyrate) depolymerase
VTDVTAGHHKPTCDGLVYDVEIPTACTSGGCGVVVDIHGTDMNADQEDKSTGLRALAQTMSYVIVQPNSPGGLIPDFKPTRDDPKIWSFLSDVRAALAIDAKKIHFTGLSEGGAMTWHMVCDHADEIASAAPAAAGDDEAGNDAMDCPFNATRSPSQPVPVLHMHGTQDGLVPFSKGQMQRDLALAAWGLSSPMVVASDATYTRTRYAGPNGLVYEFLQHDYVVDPPALPINIGGHCLPGGNDLKANASATQLIYLSCAPPNSFVWGKELMGFFQAHPRP